MELRQGMGHYLDPVSPGSLSEGNCREHVQFRTVRIRPSGKLRSAAMNFEPRTLRRLVGPDWGGRGAGDRESWVFEGRLDFVSALVLCAPSVGVVLQKLLRGCAISA